MGRRGHSASTRITASWDGQAGTKSSPACPGTSYRLSTRLRAEQPEPRPKGGATGRASSLNTSATWDPHRRASKIGLDFWRPARPICDRSSAEQASLSRAAVSSSRFPGATSTPRSAVLHQLGDAGDAGGDHGPARGHRLHQHDWHPFGEAREAEHVASA